MKPAVLRHRNGFQLSYDSPPPIYDCRVYPRQSSNGSTILIYGHGSGLRVIWYAGRKFKPQVGSQAKVNGTKKADDPMVIDLEDDDDEPSQLQAEFEQEEDEVDPSHPYHGILRHLDIDLGTSAIHLAVPHVPTDLSDASQSPGILHNHAVVAVACADLSIRLLAFPLQPPAPDISDPPQVGVQNVRLLGPGFHQDLATSVALTHTREVDDSGDEHGNGEHQKWSFLVASTSCTGSGLLLVHQIPIKGNSLIPGAEDCLPIRRERLRLPLLSAKLSFNTSTYPAERHSSLLITLPDASCVKVYQVFKQYTLDRNRRGSVGTTDSASSTRSGSNLGKQDGKFLVTLLPEFSKSNNSDPNEPRKSILDAKWILGGQAILSLIRGGEWGIWDLEAAGPASSSDQGLIKGKGKVSGIIGGSWTKFAINGVLQSPSSGSNPTNSPLPASSSTLVTATPHTRKVQAQGLFTGEGRSSPLSHSSQRGSISTVISNNPRNDETVIISHGLQNVYIPSILSYWKSAATGKGGFAASSSNSVILTSLRLGGENTKSVDLLPQLPKQEDAPFGVRNNPNFVVATSTRLVLFVTPLTELFMEENSPMTNRPMSMSRDTTDRSLLQQGVLDVDGMDRVLEGMDSATQSIQFTGGKSASQTKPNFGKSVGFSQDVNMDTTPDLPSPTTTRRLQLLSHKGTERRLFS